MKTEIIPHLFEESLVRIVMTDGQPWFVAKDVCAALDLDNPSLAVNGRSDRRGSGGLDDDEKGVATVNTLGGDQEVIIINESGLYALIFKSRKPEARRFRKWVTSEILPAIRKTGSYDNQRHYTSAQRNFLNLTKDLISLGIQPDVAAQNAVTMTLNIVKPTSSNRPQQPGQKSTGYKEEYKVYAERYDTSERTIKRWVAIGKRSGHPCPLDDPQSLSAWWEKTRGQEVPNRFEPN
jgi:prophage antirepressor-like protein